jgi:hypothetical protein
VWGTKRKVCPREAPPPCSRLARAYGNFTRWKEHDSYQKALDRLLRDLRVEKV